MKKSSLLTIVLLVVLLVVGWGAQIGNIISRAQNFKNYVKEASQLREDGLYQKSIASLDSALAIKEDEDVRENWLEVYALAYEDAVVTDSEYAAALRKACDLYPKDTEKWEALLAFYISVEDLGSANKVCLDIESAGVKSDRIAELKDEVRYTYSIASKTYLQVSEGRSGHFSLFDGERWGVLDAEGDTETDFSYSYIGPYNKDTVAMFVSQKGSRLIDGDGLVHAIMDTKFIACGILSDGLLPVCLEDGKWRYWDQEKDELVFGTYERASNFVDGTAAVCEDGTWRLIDTEGDTVKDTKFDDVKMHSNGDHLYDGLMVASKNGKYGLYDAKGKSKGDGEYADADVYLGGYIAYQGKDGLWGYADKSGDTVIEPQFDQARSFSGGLGAVCKEGLWGFIKDNGKIVIDLQYLDALYFNEEGVGFVSVEEKLYCMVELRF